ncbi:WD40-repeat-containing domain protein [Zychaea mexicana]|uniref:WD40-repeat-containing domain protein n=1 Tax=Zychaea mexicana TaxID=64656 RepID=UPI0022FDF703|nr:WD40-repeat-containing domain protein [Zychaea mexicana]KAI9493664.1 WD40-repeat-containing domain protein [Zychaea mexicana]
MTAFAKKPRSLLFNIAENDSSMKDLLISTSLKGDMQFWNAATRSMIANKGPEHFYKNGWIEELCWITPTTLALCMGRSKPEANVESSVLLTHIKEVKRDDVDIRVQAFNENPHVKEMLDIAPVQLGQTGSVGVERASFVTGGSDHLVCLWDMIRDSPQEDFALTDVNKLNINHTNSVQALCYDSYNDRLYTGGADSKLFTYDMVSQKTINELRIGNRINHIEKNPKDPNLSLISQAQTSDQFAIYDQRMLGVCGLQLSFGFSESENLSRYIKPDWHQDGYIVVCGSQSESKVHFWDIRYSGVQRGPCFSLPTQGTAPSRILQTLFLPNRNTLLSVSSTRTMTWTDFSVQANSKISTI